MDLIIILLLLFGLLGLLSLTLFIRLCSEPLVKVFGKREDRGNRAELDSLREKFGQLQGRVETLEAVLAGKEFQAGQRVAKALEEGRLIPEVASSEWQQHATQRPSA